jgi:hemolysin III
VAISGSEWLGDEVAPPKLRGVLHLIAFFIALPVGVALVMHAKSGTPQLGALVFAASVVAMLGASSLFHRIRWTPSRKRWVCFLDHASIYVLIAGTYTPFALLVLRGPLAAAILIAVWSCVVAGAVLKLLWVDAPKPLMAALYVAVGLVSVLALPQLIERLGIVAVSMIGLGGALYVAGALIYAFGRPDPAPAVFGYHELFHLLVVLAAACFYAVVLFWVI